MKKFFLYGILIFTLCVLFSCADASPELILASGSMVFDYEENDSLPDTRLAVFVQMESEVQRAETLVMESRSSGYCWRVTSPKLFRNGDKKWACYTNLQPPAKAKIPDGVYDFRYIDAAGEEAASSFIINYPEQLLTTKAENVRDVLKSVTENIALYDKNNVLIFFGKSRNNWVSNASILRDFNAAVTKRRCLSANNNRVICLLPEESLLEKKKAEIPANAAEQKEDDDSDE